MIGERVGRGGGGGGGGSEGGEEEGEEGGGLVCLMDPRELRRPDRYTI